MWVDSAIYLPDSDKHSILLCTVTILVRSAHFSVGFSRRRTSFGSAGGRE